MDRRGILKGLGAASIGGSAIFGSGALTQLSSARTVSVNVTNDNSSVISLSADDAADGIGTIEEGPNGQLSFTLSDINADSQLVIGDAPSNNPTSHTISDPAFTISDNLGSDALDSDEAIAVEVEVSGSGSASGLGLVFLPTNNTDDLANGATTGYTQSDQDFVAGANLQNRGTDIAALPSRYDTENDSAKFLLDKESTVGAELILQADADDLDSDPSFDITITAQPVDAPAELTSSHIGMNVSQITGSSTATHELEVTNNYDSDVTAGISISETGLSVSQSNVSIASLTTTTVEIDAAHLDTITPTVDATNDSTGNTVTAQQQLSVPGSASGGTQSTRIELSGTYYDVHAFENTGTETFAVSSGVNADALVVGGGGGGGSDNAGGGGAGGLVYSTVSTSTTDSPYDITVGAGGNGGGSENNGKSGDNSEAFGLIANGGGGGGGGADSQPALDGGSGGGGDGERDPSPGATTQDGTNSSVTFDLGTSGGSGGDPPTGSPDDNDMAGGGGGGATASGVDAGDDPTKPGNGGDGKDMSAYFGTGFGENGYFAGGGAGGVGNEAGSPLSGWGTGGQGGGGDHGKNSVGTYVGEAGQANTGGGGAGGSYTGSNNAPGGDGGSGIVLVRYEVQ